MNNEVHLAIQCPGLASMRDTIKITSTDTLSHFIEKLRNDGVTDDGILKTILSDSPPFSSADFNHRGTVLGKLKKSFMDYWS